MTNTGIRHIYSSRFPDDSNIHHKTVLAIFIYSPGELWVWEANVRRSNIHQCKWVSHIPASWRSRIHLCNWAVQVHYSDGCRLHHVASMRTIVWQPSILTILYSSMHLRCPITCFNPASWRSGIHLWTHTCSWNLHHRKVWALTVLYSSMWVFSWTFWWHSGLNVELMVICWFLTSWYSSCRASRRYVFIRHIHHTPLQTMPIRLQTVPVFVRRGIHYGDVRWQCDYKEMKNATDPSRTGGDKRIGSQISAKAGISKNHESALIIL